MPKATILCVDPDPQVLRLYAANLERAGYAVVTVQSPETAARYLRSPEIDAFIFEYDYPGNQGAGLGMVSYIGGELAEKPIIIYTARNGMMDIAQAIREGADAYLVKPFNPVRLLSKLRKFFRDKPGEA